VYIFPLEIFLTLKRFIYWHFVLVNKFYRRRELFVGDI